jgi:hypothetical protein
VSWVGWLASEFVVTVGSPGVCLSIAVCALSRRPGRPCIDDPSFKAAPQRTLYPDASARPSPAAVADFLKAHGIRYIYVDAMHPNTLVHDVIPIATSGDAGVWWVR